MNDETLTEKGMPIEIVLPKKPARPKRLRAAKPPRLSIDQILGWADIWHARMGRWPNHRSGPAGDLAETTWGAINSALQRGLRGLAGGSSLAKLLARYRGVRNKQDLPPLTVQQILAWADAHYQRIGSWPGGTSGPVWQCPGETWRDIDHALGRAGRGLPGGTSLRQLLRKHGRGKKRRERIKARK
jgi:hypothetical protein